MSIIIWLGGFVQTSALCAMFATGLIASYTSEEEVIQLSEIWPQNDISIE